MRYLDSSYTGDLENQEPIMGYCFSPREKSKNEVVEGNKQSPQP